MPRDPTIYPIDSFPTSGGVAVAAATTVALVANRFRVYAAFVNDSVQTIYLGLGVAAVLNDGIRLNPNGGAYEITGENLFLGAVNAISAAGAANLTVSEGI